MLHRNPDLVFFLLYIDANFLQNLQKSKCVEDGHLANRDEEEAEALNDLLFFFFPSVFSKLTGLVRPGSLSQYHQCGSSHIPFLDTKSVRDHLYQVNGHKSMESGGIRHRALMELGDVMA